MAYQSIDDIIAETEQDEEANDQCHLFKLKPRFGADVYLEHGNQ